MNRSVNIELAKSRGLSDETIYEIQVKQNLRHEILTEMEKLDSKENTEELEILYSYWEETEFELQDLWGFERDDSHHKHWNVPHCSCPKLDNEDIYPSKNYWVNSDCIYHGEIE